MPPTLYSVIKLMVEEYPVSPEVKDKLAEIIESANVIFRPYLASPLILENNQVRGVLFLEETARFLQILQLISLEMGDVPLKFALGVGSLSKQSLENQWEGPAVKSADRALKEAQKGDVDVCVRLLSPFLTRTVNTLFAVESDLRNDWSAAHREAIRLVRQGMTQTEMADILGVTQAAISQRLKHARWDRYCEVTDTLRELLDQSRWRTLLPWDVRKGEKRKKASRT